MDPTLLNNLLASLRNTIFSVLTQNGTPFQQLGLNIFRTVTIVMIVIAGAASLFRTITRCTSSALSRVWSCWSGSC